MKSRTIMAGAALAAAFLASSALAVLGYQRLSAPKLAPVTAYTLLDGTSANTAQLRGKVVLVNFWATTCSICVHEMPQLMATHRQFAERGFETLAVAMSYDPPVSVMNFAQSRPMPFRVAMDHTGSIAASFGDIQGTPTSVLINRRGEIVKRFVGAPNFDELNRRIDALLAQQS